jgi:hypothetical protein
MMKRILSLLILFTPLFSLGQFTAIPDANFEQALIDQGHDTGTPDGQVLTANISGLTFLDVSSNLIGNLSGIQDFTALTSLNFSDNSGSLTSIDLSQNTALIHLRCEENRLTSLDVTQNTALTHLTCSWNQLISLDVTQNTALTNLSCEDNQLTSLDVSQNTALTYLRCDDNLLTCLNVANGNNTFLTDTYFIVVNNLSLTCIEVDDVAYSAANWTTYIDAGVTFSTDCNNACSTVGISEYSNQPRKLIRILDLLGRETNFKPNTPLIYQYDDGSVEKVIREY